MALLKYYTLFLQNSLCYSKIRSTFILNECQQFLFIYPRYDTGAKSSFKYIDVAYRSL